MSKKLVVVELFAGIGGFSLGIEEAYKEITGSADGIEFWANDIDPYACAIYRYQSAEGNKGAHVHEGDLQAIDPADIPDADIITFGWPCQSNSVSGKRAGLRDKEKSGLLYEAIKVLKAKRPKFFIAENVPGLFSVNEGLDFFETVIEMTACGYIIDFNILNTNWYLPQNRERIIFVGVNAEWIIKQIQEDKKGGSTKRSSLYEPIIQGYLLTLLQRIWGEHVELHKYVANTWVLNTLTTTIGLKEKLKSLERILISQLETSQNYYPDTQSQQSLISDSVLGSQDGEKVNGDGIKKGMRFDMTASMIDQSTETSSRKKSGGSYSQRNESTISTLINETIESKISICAKIEDSIKDSIVVLKTSFPDYWEQVLSNLTKIQENTRYAQKKTKLNPMKPNEGRKMPNIVPMALRTRENREKELEIREGSASNCLTGVQTDAMIIEAPKQQKSQPAKRMNEQLTLPNFGDLIGYRKGMQKEGQLKAKIRQFLLISNFQYPQPQSCPMVLSDILLDVVDPKYFLSEKQQQMILNRYKRANKADIDFNSKSRILTDSGTGRTLQQVDDMPSIRVGGDVSWLIEQEKKSGQSAGQTP